ncbi:MAG: hypothetical protein K1X66_08275 [Verrucomicrobiae bacterium]|nr:hypothetical protein [Verrucomicrobiae bacterium]
MEENEQNQKQESAFSFGVADQFKEKTNQDLTFFEQKFKLTQDLNPNLPSNEQLRRQGIDEAFKGRLPFESYDYWDKRLKDGKDQTPPKSEFKNPLSFEVGDGVKVEPIVKPELTGGKPGIKELGVKGKFDWGQIEAKGEFKNSEFQKASVTVSGGF